MRKIYALVLLLFPLLLSAQNENFAHVEDLSQIILKGQFYSEEEFDLLEEKLSNIVFSFEKLHYLDSLSLGEDYVLFQSDETFAYQLILEVHLSSGEVSLVKIPIYNTSLLSSEIANSFQVHLDTGAWSFQVRLVPDTFHRSNILKVPEKGDASNYIYTFISHDQGQTWRLSLEYEKR